eukprot:361151-Chlamydomonas_euryale.AAC.4
MQKKNDADAANQHPQVAAGVEHKPRQRITDMHAPDTHCRACQRFCLNTVLRSLHSIWIIHGAIQTWLEMTGPKLNEQREKMPRMLPERGPCKGAGPT